MDYHKWQRRTVSGHCCAVHKTSKHPCAQQQSRRRPTPGRIFPLIALQHSGTDGAKRSSGVKSLLSSVTDHQLEESRDVDRRRLRNPPALTCKKPSVSTLRTRCQRLEQENAAILKKIIEMEDESMSLATQKLRQYDRAGSNVLAVERWSGHQIEDSRKDLEESREMRQEHINALRSQLQACEEKLRKAHKDLQQLREYRDRGHAVTALRAADLERQLRVLSEEHQDQVADVEDMVGTEIKKLLEYREKVKEGALQAVVGQHIKCLPLALRRMCLQNHEMMKDIWAYKQMIAELQDEVPRLLETGKSLREAREEEAMNLRRALLLNRPLCLPDEEVVLRIPLRQQLSI